MVVKCYCFVLNMPRSVEDKNSLSGTHVLYLFMSYFIFWHRVYGCNVNINHILRVIFIAAPVMKPEDSSIVGPAVGGTIGCVLAIALIALALVFVRKRYVFI